MLDDLTPIDLDLPAQFQDWRPIQREAIERGVYTDKRFLMLAMPTGSGKSLAVTSIARVTGYRTVILTGTKGLQDQYVREFGQDIRASRVLTKLHGRQGKRTGKDLIPPDNQLIDIRGKANYRCNDFCHADCDEGSKIGCRDCTGYGQSLTIARNAQMVVTNYKFWMNINRPGSAGLCRVIKPNPIDLLVLDEAHLAPEELASFLAIQIYEQEILNLLYIPALQTDSVKEWRDFAKEYHPTAKLEADERKKELALKGIKATRAEITAQKQFEALADKLDKLKQVKDDGWVCEQQEARGRVGKRWEFDPVWPGISAERTLFLGIPHIILISATLRPKTGGLLGAKWVDTEFREWPRIFPANRCPIYSIPAQRDDGVEIRINYRTKDDDLQRWVERIDEIIESRLDRKGIIHTVSYDRQRYLLEHSRFGKKLARWTHVDPQYAYQVGLFLGNTTDKDSLKAAEVVHDFKQGAAPLILLSPSFSTGWDFPGDECEWQIIIKVPFPHSQSKVMKERVKRDPQYSNYLAMQDLIQSSGRGMRHEKDRCETFIVDASIGWFLGQNRPLKPTWFDPRKMAKVPPVPPAL